MIFPTVHRVRVRKLVSSRFNMRSSRGFSLRMSTTGKLDGARHRPMGRCDAPWDEATPDGARRRPMGRGDARWGEATPDGARRRPMGQGDARWGEARRTNLVTHPIPTHHMQSIIFLWSKTNFWWVVVHGFLRATAFLNSASSVLPFD